MNTYNIALHPDVVVMPPGIDGEVLYHSLKPKTSRLPPMEDPKKEPKKRSWGRFVLAGNIIVGSALALLLGHEGAKMLYDHMHPDIQRDPITRYTEIPKNSRKPYMSPLKPQRFTPNTAVHSVNDMGNRDLMTTDLGDPSFIHHIRNHPLRDDTLIGVSDIILNGAGESDSGGLVDVITKEHK